MKKLICFVLLSLLLQGLYAQHPPLFQALQTDSVNLKLYTLDIHLVQYSYKPNGVKFLVIHDNEDTGVKAAIEYIRWTGGILQDTQYGDARDFVYSLQDDSFRIDPNGIFSPLGIQKRLKQHPYSSPEAAEGLKLIARSILAFYRADSLGYFLTLHNNADGGFGIYDYETGGELSQAADSLYINPQMDPDDLIYVTDARLFSFFKARQINTVLQHKFIEDDGSLSVYAMQHNIPYLNVEVQHGHFDENLRLIEIAVEALKRLDLLQRPHQP